jgi:hypothetical protein
MNAMKTGNHPLERRGALLLLVLCVLTLFLLMGTVLVTLATRTRTTAQAFASATAGRAARPLLARTQLEQAVLALVRGGPDADNAGLSESLLADMYGTTAPLEGKVTELVQQDVLVRATVQVTGAADGGAPEPVRAADLRGRVITFTPDSDSGESITSLRIMSASGPGPFTCWIARPPTDSDADLPTAPCSVVINQPAFVAETHDAFDGANRWLTQVALEDGRVSSVPRPAFAAVGMEPTVDNDNDGVRDGIWLENIFDSLPATDGGRLEFDVSYLVLDLDGRVNVNAHGSRTSIDFPAADGWWTNAPRVPTGSGYGPADIDASLLFVEPVAANRTQTDPPAASDRWRRIVGSTPNGELKGLAPTAEQRRPVPLVGSVDGRYGSPAVAGLGGNDPMSRQSELLYGNDPLVDLKSMIKVQMQTTTSGNSGSAVPRMVYYCPDWGYAGYSDDPYEMRLDSEAPRPVELRAGGTQADNPFALAELEAVLRQFDSDASTLPQRLAVVLDDACQRSRMLVTTDSWDTPGLTGPIAAELTDFIAALRCNPADVMSPDILAGLRFDINRPFPEDTQAMAAKLDYCKHLYVLLVAHGLPANETAAQWAANVVDYRDTDSRFTRFQFDTDPADGWGPGTAGWSDANVVWGAERPELVIAQTLAWRGGNDPNAGELYVSLHRPWDAVLVQKNNATAPADVLDPALASNADANLLDLAKRQGQDPIWRLRFDESSKFVRFDLPQGNAPHPAFPATSTTYTGVDRAELAVNSYLVIKPNGNSSEGIGVQGGLSEFNITQGGVFRSERWSGAGNDQPGSDTMVFLERLADPSSAWNETTNPYVPVDKLGVKLVNRSGSDPNNWRSFFRDPPFWRDRPFSKIMRPPVVSRLEPEATNWLPWPNRAFISHAELLLVPQGNAIGMLGGYDIPKNKRTTNPYYFLPTPKLLESTIVPSRFSGTQISVSPAALSEVGMQRIPFNQLSRWREPGRVNLNTILPNRNCSDPQREQAVWWAVLGPDATVSHDEFAAAGPAQSVHDLLTLMQDDAIHLDVPAAAGVKGNSWKKNRPYELNPAAAYATAIRIANVATIRSHLFAVWLTLRIRDTSPGGNVSYHRLFAVIDRSRPVGFAEGRDLNVRNTIRVLRFLE